ncbi:MAG: phosphohydrolase [Desulfobacteraceae bacterium]|nr:MAG: phosphohydrolase [Desulfobacteraceae bacterium]
MRCPGQDTQFWNHSAIFEAPCPKCGLTVEFFKDDTTRKCRCGHRFVNPRMDFGCAAYCQFAEQCLGDLPPELVAQKEDLLKDRVAVAVKRHLKSDFKRIARAARRARHAERIIRAGQGNLAAVLMAAYLWELDDPAAAQGDLPAAQAILSDLKAPAALIEKVCAIIARKNASNADAAEQQVAAEHQVVADAAMITDLEDRFRQDPGSGGRVEQYIQNQLHSRDGRDYARELFSTTP